MSNTTRFARQLAAAGLVVGTSAATFGASALTASAAPSAAPAAKVVHQVSVRADVDGDTRNDDITLRTIGSTRREGTVRLTAKLSSTGRTASVTLMHVLAEAADRLDGMYVGIQTIDGVRGEDVILDLTGGIGDGSAHRIYTIRHGKWQILKAPGAKSVNTPWTTQYAPLGIDGYRFSTSRGVQRVVRTHLVPSDEGAYSGSQTSYRWGRTGWVRTATKKLTYVSAEKYAGEAGWNGLSLKVEGD